MKCFGFFFFMFISCLVLAWCSDHKAPKISCYQNQHTDTATVKTLLRLLLHVSKHTPLLVEIISSIPFFQLLHLHIAIDHTQICSRNHKVIINQHDCSIKRC